MLNFLHHLFVPKEANNYRAKSLHIDSLSFYLVFALLLTVVFKNLGSTTGNVLGFATDITVEKLYALTNNERSKYNLPPLIYNEKLAKAAQEKAQDMFKKDYWAHYAPDGVTPWDFMIDSGYKYEFAGENLAKNFLFSNNVVDAWMKSESHKKNIIREEYKDMGFAIVNGVMNGEETTLIVQMFGKPQTFTKEITQKPVESQLNKGSILSKDTNAPKINLLKPFSQLNLIFIFILIAALLLDLYFACKMKIIRISGKNIAHVIFLGFILISLFIITKGSII